MRYIKIGTGVLPPKFTACESHILYLKCHVEVLFTNTGKVKIKYGILKTHKNRTPRLGLLLTVKLANVNLNEKQKVNTALSLQEIFFQAT